MHTNLGGSGKPGWHEERARPYTIEVEVMPESKTGAQVPAAFHKFTDSRWFKGALYQSAMAVPVGSGVVPAVVIDGRWLIADIEPRTKR
jgi:hypothetical protein